MTTPSPATPVSATSIQGVWRWERPVLWWTANILVIDSIRARCPPCCVWSGATDDVEFRIAQFYYKDKVPIPGAVGALVNAMTPLTTRTVTIPVSKAYWQSCSDTQLHVAIMIRWIALAIILAGIAVAAVGGMLISPNPPPNSWPALTIVFGLVGATIGVITGIVGLVFPYLQVEGFKNSETGIAAMTIKGPLVYVSDAHPDFLKLLPPLPPELAN